jgi:hypothetical protein
LEISMYYFFHLHHVAISSVTILQIMKCLCCKWYVNLHFLFDLFFSTITGD